MSWNKRIPPLPPQPSLSKTVAKKQHEPWQASKKTFLQQNVHLLETGKFSDCTFIVGDQGTSKKFECHRLMLAKASCVFESMLYGPMAEKTDIFVTDVEPNIFQMLLDFLYTGNIKLPNCDETIELCIVADKYMIVDLKNECIKKLSTDDLVPSNALQIHHVAKLLNLEELEQNAMKVILECTAELLECDTFLHASQEQLLMIVSQDALNIRSEAQLISRCLEWGDMQAENKGLPNTTENLQKILGPVLKHLRFLTLTEKEFITIAKKTNICSVEEKWEAIVEIFDKGSKRQQHHKFAFANTSEPRQHVNVSDRVLEGGLRKKHCQTASYAMKPKKSLNQLHLW